ncbi:MAG: hypothetical protein AAF604_00955 [Acidobacteriota bacterium]
MTNPRKVLAGALGLACLLGVIAIAGSSGAAIGVYQEAPKEFETPQVECRFRCADGHDGVLACPAGTPVQVCADLLGDPCVDHGGLVAVACDNVR